ncbi:MAG: hypothetical protein JY451_12860 [Erythrobacter sp.]|nr:MAG: hypothetical protein JY451_12860 [Erythrobacter sp.]
MGHFLTAIIGSETTLGQFSEMFGSPFPTAIPFGLWVLPLNEQRLDLLAMSGDRTFEGFEYLSPKIARAIARGLGDGSALYVETFYHGGTGGQGAALLEDGELIWTKAESTYKSENPNSIVAYRPFGPRLMKSPISEGLARLGVVASSEHDEFDSVGLGNFRSLENLGLDY